MFGLGKNSFLGIDIGTSAIKVVELKVSDNRPELVNYAWINFSDFEKGSASPLVGEGALSLYLKRIINAGKFKTKNAYVSIPTFGAIITLVEFPKMDEKDLEQAMKFEAPKYIPMHIEDVALSWDIVEKVGTEKKLTEVDAKSLNTPESKGKMEVLLVAAPKSKVASYEKIIKESGLSLKSIEIESFSLARSLVGSDPGNFLLVDIGSRVCNIALVEKGVVKMNRNIDSGGHDITRIIASSLNLGEEAAERMKVSGKEILFSNLNLSFPSLEIITGEIRRMIDAYHRNQSNARIDAVILVGGTARLKGIEKIFSDTLGAKVIIGNPFGRVDVDKKMENKTDELKSYFAVAVGLALKGVDDYLRK